MGMGGLSCTGRELGVWRGKPVGMGGSPAQEGLLGQGTK